MSRKPESLSQIPRPQLSMFEIEALIERVRRGHVDIDTEQFFQRIQAELYSYSQAPFLRSELSLPGTANLVNKVLKRSKNGERSTVFVVGPPGAGKTWFTTGLTMYLATREGVPDDVHMHSYDASMVNSGQVGTQRMDTLKELEESNWRFALAIGEEIKMNRQILTVDSPAFYTATFDRFTSEALETVFRSRILGRDVGTEVIREYYKLYPEQTFFVGLVPSVAIQYYQTRGRKETAEGAVHSIIDTYNSLAYKIALMIRSMPNHSFTPEIMKYLEDNHSVIPPEDVMQEIESVAQLSPEISHKVILEQQQMRAFVGGAVMNHNLAALGVPPDHCVFPYIRPDKSYFSQDAA